MMDVWWDGQKGGTEGTWGRWVAKCSVAGCIAAHDQQPVRQGPIKTERPAALVSQAGADVGGGRLDEARWTPLHQAAQSGNAAVVRLLLASGASLGTDRPSSSFPLSTFWLSRPPFFLLDPTVSRDPTTT